MPRFKTQNPEIQWQTAGIIKVYNYPQNPYFSVVYKEYRKGKLGSKEVEGEFISLTDKILDDKPEIKALVKIIGEAQNTILQHLPTEPFLTEKI